MKSCDNCAYAIYDSVPYGSTDVDYLSGCQKEDEVSEEEVEKNCCHCWKPYDWEEIE